MISISIIGFGNVARHLARAFRDSPHTGLVQIYSRSIPDDAEGFDGLLVHDLDELREADVYILSVSDDAVPQLSRQLPFASRLVVHTAGSTSMDAISDGQRRGVFYPLQTLSKNKEVDFSNVPLCIESERPEDLELLRRLASAISRRVYEIDSVQRRAVHVAAVFASNFSNHLYKLGNDICDEHHIPFDILHPLIDETAHKIHTLPPAQAQTGPAIRHDQSTIAAQLELLSDDNQKNIYTLLTQSIQHDRKKL